MSNFDSILSFLGLSGAFALRVKTAELLFSCHHTLLVPVDFLIQQVQRGLHLRHPGHQLVPLFYQQGLAGVQGGVSLLEQVHIFDQGFDLHPGGPHALHQLDPAAGLLPVVPQAAPGAVQEAGQMSSYDALAASYDALTVDVEYRRRADYLTRQFHRSALPVETVLDLACGTGTMACLLAERGYRMIAVDGSEEMLTQAAWKAAALEQPPMFLHQSMPRLHLGMEVDAAISTLDALNYLTRTADLRETLRRVYRWLRPGGLFLFDVNTPYKLRRMDGQVYLDETEDSYCVWRTFYAPGRKICTYQVDLFRLNANGSWDRAFEEHRERAWGREELETYLTEAGFGAVTVTGDLTSRPPAAEEDRWIFRCQKPVRPR